MAVLKTRKTFGKRVRELRKNLGYSQEELADKAGLHRTYIGSVERGEVNISIDNIVIITKALKTDLSSIFKNL